MDIIPIEDFEPRDYLKGGAMSGCLSGKHRYPTGAEARDALDKIRRRRRRRADGKKPIAVYPCGLCGGHHLTSRPR